MFYLPLPPAVSGRPSMRAYRTCTRQGRILYPVGGLSSKERKLLPDTAAQNGVSITREASSHRLKYLWEKNHLYWNFLVLW